MVMLMLLTRETNFGVLGLSGQKVAKQLSCWGWRQLRHGSYSCCSCSVLDERD